MAKISIEEMMGEAAPKPTEQSPSPGEAVPPPAVDPSPQPVEAEAPKRRRGRPKGSKNKPKIEQVPVTAPSVTATIEPTEGVVKADPAPAPVTAPSVTIPGIHACGLPIQFVEGNPVNARKALTDYLRGHKATLDKIQEMTRDGYTEHERSMYTIYRTTTPVPHHQDRFVAAHRLFKAGYALDLSAGINLAALKGGES